MIYINNIHFIKVIFFDALTYYFMHELQAQHFINVTHCISNTFLHCFQDEQRNNNVSQFLRYFFLFNLLIFRGSTAYTLYILSSHVLAADIKQYKSCILPVIALWMHCRVLTVSCKRIEIWKFNTSCKNYIKASWNTGLEGWKTTPLSLSHVCGEPFLSNITR